MQTIQIEKDYNISKSKKLHPYFGPYHDDNGFYSLKNNFSYYVGIIGNRIGKSEKYKWYEDKKLFPEHSTNPLLFQLYDAALQDSYEFSTLEKSFVVEPEIRIRLNRDLFNILIPELFLIELKKILDYGLNRKYQQREDNLLFAKGKINMKKQIKNEITHNPRIYCTYWDFTTNIFINQALLYASDLLSHNHKVPHSIRSSLINYISSMRQEFVEDVILTVHDFRKNHYIPERYKLAIILSEAIISSSYHGIELTKEVECPSFLINAPTVWESFLRASIRKSFIDWDIQKIKQQHSCLTPFINIIPDLLVTKNDKLLIIDAKYKSGKVSTGDLYQMCAYIAHFKEKNPVSFLLYLEDEENRYPEKYNFKIGKNQEEYPIHILYLNDLLNEAIHQNNFFKYFSDNLKKIIENSIQ